MKESIYNTYLDKNNELIIYNSVSSAVLLLDAEKKYEFIEFLEKKKNLSAELYNALFKGGMIVDDELNERSSIKFEQLKRRIRGDSLSLTIAPTLDCNFRCPYCYEKGVEHKYINDETIKDLINFAEKQKKEKIHVTWYGGEPTLCLKQIRQISEELIRLFGEDNYAAAMVSNGYLLNREVALMLKKYKVSTVQITLDGPRELHDSRRIFKDGRGTFDQIVDNIKNIYDILNISIRINVDKTNINEAEQLIDYLEKSDLLDKLRFYIAPVDDINENTRNHNCFTKRDFSKFEIEFYSKFSKYHVMKPPIPTLGICGAISMDSFIIAPDGKLYKCWDEIGLDEYSIGNVKEGVTNQKNYKKWISYDVDDYNKNCNDCKNFPVCFGGCPYQNMKRKGENHCISFQYNGEYVLNQMYDSQKEQTNDE